MENKSVRVVIEVHSLESLLKIMLMLFKKNIDCVVLDKDNQKVGATMFTVATGRNWFIDNEIKF